MSPLIHVARDGAPLGQFRRDLIDELLKNATLRPSDIYYDESRREWLLVGDYKNNQKFTLARRSRESSPSEPPSEQEQQDSAIEEAEISESEHSSRRRRRRRRSEDSNIRKPRKRHPAESALPGWIAALVAISVAAGLWAWATSLREQLNISTNQVKELENNLASLKRQIGVLLEMAPPGVVRGVITTETHAGRLFLLSGISVAAYRLDDVRGALLRVANLPIPVDEQEFASMVSTIQAALPPPIAMSLSDSSGRFEFPIPEPGNFVLVATGLKQVGGNTERLLWTVEVPVSDSPSPVVSLDERNSASLRSPKFKIQPARR